MLIFDGKGVFVASVSARRRRLFAVGRVGSVRRDGTGGLLSAFASGLLSAFASGLFCAFASGLFCALASGLLSAMLFGGGLFAGDAFGGARAWFGGVIFLW